MATAYRWHIAPDNTGLWGISQTRDAADKASELLQKDMERHHVYFNDDGFHNHISHQVLALYGTGAPARHLQKGYDDNAGYQRPALPRHDGVVAALQSWDRAPQYLAREQYYPDFLAFFQRAIDAEGWQAVLAGRVFAGTAAADDMLARLHASFLHPLIQLMHGVEWAQPAGVAQGLAQASVHRGELGGFLLEAERRSRSGGGGGGGGGGPMPPVAELLEQAAADHKVARAARFGDSNKILDGVLRRAREEMLALAARVRVRPEEVEERTAEMCDAAVYVAAGAAVHPPKVPKFDFFLIHHANSSPFYLALDRQDWVAPETKARLLEWKIRMDLVEYAARGAPPLRLDLVAAYRPKREGASSLEDVLARLHGREEDGHAIKLARALGASRAASQKFEDRPWVRVRGDDLWNKIYNLLVDSVEGEQTEWVRSAGMEEAWEDIPDETRP